MTCRIQGGGKAAGVFRDPEQIQTAVGASTTIRIAFGEYAGKAVRRIGHGFGDDGEQSLYRPTAVAASLARKPAKAATPVLLSDGKIVEADVDAPMQADIAAMSGWKRDATPSASLHP